MIGKWFWFARPYSVTTYQDVIVVVAELNDDEWQVFSLRDLNLQRYPKAKLEEMIAQGVRYEVTPVAWEKVHAAP